MSVMKFEVTVNGCDDSTTVVVEGDEVIEAFLTKLSEAITAASTYGCMPIMTFKRLENDNPNKPI